MPLPSSKLKFDVTISAASGSTLFNNTSVLGDVVFFAFEELTLGGSYTLDNTTIKVGMSGRPLTVITNEC